MAGGDGSGNPPGSRCESPEAPPSGPRTELNRSGEGRDVPIPADRTGRAMPLSADPVRIIADSPLMRSVDRSSLEGLGAELEWVVLDEDEVLVLDGNRGDALYFVASGRLEIVQPPEHAGAAGNGPPVPAAVVTGDVIGEMRALRTTESTTIRAVVGTHLVKLEKSRLDQYVTTRPELGGKLGNVFIPLFYRNEIIQVLHDIFGKLTEELLSDIERSLTWERVARGDVLFHRGETSDGLFIVVSGRLRELGRSDAGGERIVDEIVQGDIAGEAGILTDEVQTLSVVAVRDTILLKASRESFRELAARYPKLYEWMVRQLATRLRGVIQESPSEHQCTNIVLVPANDGAPIEEFSRRLSESLSEHATCLLVSSPGIDDLLGTSGIAQTVENSPEDRRLRAWLDSWEAHVRYVIYVADSGLTNWTRRCIRQSDEVVALGIATAEPRLTAVEAEILREEELRHTKFRKTLVLVHPSGTPRPQGTMRWLNRHRVDRHFHLRTDDQDDLARVVRYVLRSEIGLVLSGGGARGFAHAGILRAIREAGLPVDIVAGVSMGSLIGAACAFSEDLDGTVSSLKARIGGMLTDYTLPFLSLARGRRFDRGVKALFGDTNIEDLWLPYFCVSSNLTRAAIVVHRSGPLWRAIRASSSLPGIIPPIVEDGDMLYDGCLLNNLPVDLMREEIRTGTLIAVDVVPPVDLDVHAADLENPSGWRVAWNRLNPFIKSSEIPDIISIINRAGVLGSVHQRQRMIEDGLADLYLRPPLGEFKILDFSVADQALEIGYAYGVREIGAWAKHQRRGSPEPASPTSAGDS